VSLLALLGESPWALFASALISSTLLPGGSEALLALQLNSGLHPAWLLILAATTGNVLGSMLTFGMGYWIACRYPLKGMDKPGQQRALRWLRRFGPGSLLLAWLPLIGDPLCLVAGWLRFPLLLSLLLITIGKTVRYLLIGGIVI